MVRLIPPPLGRAARAAARFCARVSWAWDLHSRLGFPWRQAWQRAGEWA